MKMQAGQPPDHALTMAAVLSGQATGTLNTFEILKLKMLRTTDTGREVKYVI